MNMELQSIEAKTGNVIVNDFELTKSTEVDQIVKRSKSAFDEYRLLSRAARKDFLYQIAEQIEALGQDLIDVACKETGLPEGRIKGETGRTCGQLRAYADADEKADWIEASIDFGQADRTPMPKPDIRKMNIPVGPVLVFGASNFPLAYSTAGGDTASALAAGCSVIVKAHPAHPGVSKLIGSAIEKAIDSSGMPKDIFIQVFDTGQEVAHALVKHELMASVAFTGSLKGGRAIFDLASQRKSPIPVFAEMGSINPVILLPNAMESKSEEWAVKYAGSITLGAGQFCTNPGLLMGIKSKALEHFKEVLTEKINKNSAQTMLNSGICSNYYAGLNKMANKREVDILTGDIMEDRIQGNPSFGTVSGKNFLKDVDLMDEVFGPFSLLVECESKDELISVMNQIEGQLTSTIIGEGEDFNDFKDVLDIAAQYAGRVIINGVPTGVEVCPSQNHGGPYPASTDSRFSAVGDDALRRFGRPIAYQNYPDSLLPKELQNNNPLNISRREN